MTFAISWWSLLVYLLAKIAFFAPGRTAWPGMHMHSSAFAPLHTQCMFVQRLLWCCSRQWLPRSTPQVCSQDWDRCDSDFPVFFFHSVIFKFPSSGVQGSFPSSALFWRAVGRRSFRAGCQPHGQADRKSQRAVQPAPTPTDIQTAQASSSLCSQPASAAFYFTRKCHALTQSWMLWGWAFHASSWSQPATAMPHVQSDCKPCFARRFCETLSVLSVAASPHICSCGRQQTALCGAPSARQAPSTSTRCSSSLKTTILPFCWMGRCITLLAEKTDTLDFDHECRGTMWPVQQLTLLWPQCTPELHFKMQLGQTLILQPAAMSCCRFRVPCSPKEPCRTLSLFFRYFVSWNCVFNLAAGRSCQPCWRPPQRLSAQLTGTCSAKVAGMQLLSVTSAASG